MQLVDEHEVKRNIGVSVVVFNGQIVSGVHFRESQLRIGFRTIRMVVHQFPPAFQRYVGLVLILRVNVDQAVVVVLRDAGFVAAWLLEHEIDRGDA